jgi:hypothetical protein
MTWNWCFAVDFLLSLDFVCVVEVYVLQDRPDLKKRLFFVFYRDK